MKINFYQKHRFFLTILFAALKRTNGQSEEEPYRVKCCFASGTPTTWDSYNYWDIQVLFYIGNQQPMEVLTGIISATRLIVTVILMLRKQPVTESLFKTEHFRLILLPLPVLLFTRQVLAELLTGQGFFAQQPALTHCF